MTTTLDIDAWRRPLGDYVPGNEVLTLPQPPPLERMSIREIDALLAVAPTRAALLRQLLDAGLAPDRRAAEQGRLRAERLFWFRWITGHQASFVLWRFLGLALAKLERDPTGGAPARTCASIIRAYAALLVYAASCPRDIYAEKIRPYMELSHASFSGSWAVEYAPIPGLIRSLPSRSAPRRAFEECQRVHLAVIRKLVPGGGSVLKSFQERGTGQQPTPANAQFYYDSFFLVRRGATEASELLAALVRRAHAITADLAADGLYPMWRSSAHEAPASLSTGTLRQLAERLDHVLLQGARATLDVARSSWSPEIGCRP
jgi:L-tyrosine peroxygenase